MYEEENEGKTVQKEKESNDNNSMYNLMQHKKKLRKELFQAYFHSLIS